MESTSPPTERVIRILQLLANRPNEAFSLSDLVRHLELTRATGHVIASSLCRAGYLVRHPLTKTFSLGPALITIGQAAERAHPEIVHACREIQRLDRGPGTGWSVSTLIGDEIIVLARSDTSAGEESTPRTGERIPFVPPYGSSFVAWAGEKEVDAWLSRAHPNTPAPEIEGYRKRLHFLRQHGYGVERLAETQVRLRQILIELQSESLSTDLEAQVSRLALALQHRDSQDESDASGPVSEIFVPISSRQITLSLHFHRRQLGEKEIAVFARRLLRAARRVSEESNVAAAGA